MSKYAWIIDTDYLAKGDASYAKFYNESGVAGPSTAPQIYLDFLNNDPNVGVKFQMYDDDGELYYDGRIMVRGYNPLTDALQEEHFGPLHDFGGPNAGCTEIRYWDDSETCDKCGRGGKWVSL